MSSIRLSQLRGLTAAEVTKLEKLGVKTTAALVKAAPNTRKERELAKKAGISLTRMREAVNRADLVQVKGIGPEADLLENAGVNSVKELAQRNPAALAKTLSKYVDSHSELNYRAPDAKTVAVLVDRARSLFGAGAGPINTLEEAKDRAGEVLTAYVNDVLFSNDPAGESYRVEVLGGHPKSEWPAIKKKFLAELPAYLGRGTSPLNNSQLDSADEDVEGFQLVGRFNGFYTEVKILRDDGAPKNLLVEID